MLNSAPNILRPALVIPLLFLVWCGHFLVDVMIGVWPVYKSLAQIDLAQAGMIVAGGAFIGEGSQLLFGSLSDKGYRHICIVFGMLLAAASIFLAYTNLIGVMFILYLLTCIGSGCFHPSGASLANSLMPGKRNLVMTIFASGGSLGLASSQLLYTHTHTFFEGHTAWLGIPILLMAVLLFLSWPIQQRIQQSQSTAQKPKLKDCLSFFKNKTMRSLYLSQVANQSLLWGTIFILPDALKSLGHPDWIAYGFGHFCFILGGALMMVPGGYLADKYSGRSMMLTMGIVSCLMFYTILMFGGISMYVVLPALFMLGASLAVLNPVAVACGIKTIPDRPGAVSAFLMGLVWCVSEALGPGGVGIMSKLFTDYAPVKALALLGLLFLVQIYNTMALPKENTEPQAVTLA